MNKSRSSFAIPVIFLWKARTPSEFWLYWNPVSVLYYRKAWKELRRHNVKIPKVLYIELAFLFSGMWHIPIFWSFEKFSLDGLGYATMFSMSLFGISGLLVVLWQCLPILKKWMYKIPRPVSLIITLAQVLSTMFLVGKWLGP